MFIEVIKISKSVALKRGYRKQMCDCSRPFGRSADDLRVQKSLRLRIKFLTVLNLIIQFWILSPCVSALSRYAQSVSAFLYFSAFPVPPGAIALHHLPVWFLFCHREHPVKRLHNRTADFTADLTLFFVNPYRGVMAIWSFRWLIKKINLITRVILFIGNKTILLNSSSGFISMLLSFDANASGN